MGLFKDIFGKKPQHTDDKADARPYVSLTSLNPSFTSYSGGIYEQELTRAAVERFATACSKLKPEVRGTAKMRMVRSFETAPNSYMSWPKFLARLATIYECDTTAYVVPAFGGDLRTVVGLWPLKCEFAEVVECGGEPWVRFHFATGATKAIELANVCILSKFQYESDFFGGGNVIDRTMKLIDAQNQAQGAAIKNGATIRFIGAVSGMLKQSDIDEKRKGFAEQNLSSSNETGLMIYDQTFTNVQQVKPQSYTIDAAEMERIDQNVFTYFGINKKILQNDYDEDGWGAWYEGKVEPFAVQLGEGLSQMLYTQRERANNGVSFSSNRLEYASNASKRNMIRDMVDRGVMTINQALEILQLPGIGPEGDIRIIRGEYVNASMISQHTLDIAKANGNAGGSSSDEDGGDYERKQYDSDDIGKGDEKDAE